MLIEEFCEFVRKKVGKELEKMQKSPILEVKKIVSLDFSMLGFQEFLARAKLIIECFTFPLYKDQLLNQTLGILGKCKILASASSLKTFSSQCKALPTTSFPLSPDQTLQLLTAWYQSCHNTENLRSKMMKTIEEYEILKQTTQSTDEKTSIGQLISSLKQQLSKIPNKSGLIQASSENFTEKCRFGLTEIFRHYSKQQFLLGKTPTFEYIQKNLEILTIAKFLKFCKDFSIIKEKNSQKKTKKVQMVFKRHSDFNKEMYEHHFVASMSSLAKDFFDEEYDQEFNTEWAGYTEDEKLKNFYELMGFAEPQVYLKKLKSVAANFGVEAYSRIPENDPSKRYKYNPEKYRKLKMSVDEWKMRKNQEKMNENQLNGRLHRKTSEYSLATFNSPKPSLSKKTSKGSLSSTLKLAEKNSLTFRGVSNLALTDLCKLDEEFNINDLLPSIEDEELNKYLSKPAKSYSEPQIQLKLPQILKTNDSQLSKIQSYSKKKK